MSALAYHIIMVCNIRLNYKGVSMLNFSIDNKWRHNYVCMALCSANILPDIMICLCW